MTFKEFVKHPIATTFPNLTKKLLEPRETNDSRRSFLKFGATSVTGLGAIALLSKCGPELTGPSTEGYNAVTVNGKKELTAPLGAVITAEQVTFRVTAITTPDFASEPREATVEILNSDATVAYTTRMRKGESTGEFYSPQDAAKTYAYKLECIEIPTPAPASDWAKFTLWKKKA